MEFIRNAIEIVLHIDRHISVIIQYCGTWSYLLLFGVIFAETGFVVTPFLPGDSLLFAVGAFAAVGLFNLAWLLVTLMSAAIIGDTVNYFLGKLFGEKIIQRGGHPLVKKEYLDKTHKFYEKHGGKTIILARFIPIIRTFAPFVAGVGEMQYFKFVMYNIIGALLWVSIFVLGGYFFGNIPVIKKNFSVVIIVIILISCLPVVIELLRHRIRKTNPLKN